MGDVYYNEVDPFACQWLRNLIEAGHLPGGYVDERPIQEVTPADLAGFTACHFFAGIGGWPLALQLAGWDAARPVWTGSCPCQPFSSAGKGQGEQDDRDLWPQLLRLAREFRPPVCLGEQVDGAVGFEWLDRVSADLEAEGYAVGAAVLPAACVGAPHARHRLFWAARGVPQGDTPHTARRGRPREAGCNGHAGGPGVDGRPLGNADIPRADAQPQEGRSRRAVGEPGGAGGIGSLGDPLCCGLPGDSILDASWQEEGTRGAHADGSTGQPSRACGTGRLDDPLPGRHDERDGRPSAFAGGDGQDDGLPGPAGDGHWGACRIIPCLDGKARRVPAEPGLFPLAHGLPRDLEPLLAWMAGLGRDGKAARRLLRGSGRNRTGRLKGAGNAIVPAVAALFVRAFLEAEGDL